jgi:hypothetical protein
MRSTFAMNDRKKFIIFRLSTLVVFAGILVCLIFYVFGYDRFSVGSGFLALPLDDLVAYDEALAVAAEGFWHPADANAAKRRLEDNPEQRRRWFWAHGTGDYRRYVRLRTHLEMFRPPFMKSVSDYSAQQFVLVGILTSDDVSFRIIGIGHDRIIQLRYDRDDSREPGDAENGGKPLGDERTR